MKRTPRQVTQQDLSPGEPWRLPSVSSPSVHSDCPAEGKTCGLQVEAGNLERLPASSSEKEVSVFISQG